ncbi:RNA-binding S4 domain-containing protein [Sphingobium sp. CR28]|uniref:RNA-binding S4 domain-containing protein n=1 Tax=Sphingobium sp. CR28 TaxID=3400272 RepID=UPI003FEE37FC
MRNRALPAQAPAQQIGAGPSLRIDKFLWFVRLAPNRSNAQALAERGVIRLNGRRVERAHAAVRVGDLITVPQGMHVRVVRVAALPVRRGPASEAQLCYEDIRPGEGANTHADSQSGG